MWTYWYLQEGEVEIDPAQFVTNDGKMSAVLHVDSDQPLRTDDGTLVTDEQWGVYFKPDRTSIQGGAEPIRLGNEFEVDPYPTGTIDPRFVEMWPAALSHCLERFENCRMYFRHVRSGGVGAFTVDNFPVFDYMKPNVFVVADSNHGYKMIAVGREVARVIGGRALHRCCIRSALTGSPPAICIRSPTAHTPGADRSLAAGPVTLQDRSQRSSRTRPAGRRAIG